MGPHLSASLKPVEVKHMLLSSPLLSFFLLSTKSIKDLVLGPSLDVTRAPMSPSLLSLSVVCTTRHGPCCKWLGGQALLMSEASAAAADDTPSRAAGGL